MLKSKRSKACDISRSVKDKVWERDGNRCIVCGNPCAMPNAHFIPREKGGLGIEENIVTLCQQCHYDYDHTIKRVFLGPVIQAYLESQYPAWDKKKLFYKEKKWK